MGLQPHHFKIYNILVTLAVITLLTPLINASTTSSPETLVAAETVESDTQLDLDDAETKDPGKLEIIKQIRRLNDDGSYTVGYEADDGTFKIESRDVLGNVKGTYGFVDNNGEIKRVSYTANNGTGLRNTPSPAPALDEAAQLPRYNRSYVSSSTTRRPASLSFLTSSTTSPTRATVIQAIPKRRLILSSTEGSAYAYPTTSKKPSTDPTASPLRKEPTTTVVYATSSPTTKTTAVPISTSSSKPSGQLSRPDKLEITDHMSKVLIHSPRADYSTAKPVYEHVDDKENDHKTVRGNQFRRQLAEDHDENVEAQQPAIYSQSADDATHVYGGFSATARPLFTTTSSSRVANIVQAARQRLTQSQNPSSSTTSAPKNEKSYVKPPRRIEQKTESELHYEQTTEPTSENNYLTQRPYQIPSSQGLSEATEDDRVYRRPVAPGYQLRPLRQFLQNPPPEAARAYRVPVAPQHQEPAEPEQYLRETKNLRQNDQPIAPAPTRGGQRQYYPDQASGSGFEQIPYRPNPYSALQMPYPYYDNPDRPLTVRDFERLLHLLVTRQQLIQRLAPYPQYNPYSQFGYSQIPRPPVYNGGFDPRYGYRNQGGYPGYPEPEGMYDAQNPISDRQPLYEGQRLVPRRRFNGAGQYLRGQPSENLGQIPSPGSHEYLPQEVREELLYRMLMLAIQPEQQASHHAEAVQEASEIGPEMTATRQYKKPVRSVQILGED